MAAAASLDFRHFNFLMVGMVKRVEVHHHGRICTQFGTTVGVADVITGDFLVIS